MSRYQIRVASPRSSDDYHIFVTGNMSKTKSLWGNIQVLLFSCLNLVPPLCMFWTTLIHVVSLRYLVNDPFAFSFIVMQGSCGITKLAAQKDMGLLLSVISRYFFKKLFCSIQYKIMAL